MTALVSHSLAALARRAVPSVVCFAMVAVLRLAPVAAQIPVPTPSSPPLGEEILSLPDSTGVDVDLSPYRDEKQLTRLKSGLLALLESGTATGPKRAEFEKYVLAKVAELTWPGRKETPDVLRSMIKLREIKAYATTPSSDLHDFFNAILLRELPTLVDDEQLALNVRFNYIILLGQLDKFEFVLGQRPQPEPMPEATTALLDKYRKESLDESLRIGAWLGLARHAESKLVSQARLSIAQEAAKVIALPDPPAGFSVAGHQWTRKLALQSITSLVATGSELDRPDTVKFLYDILVNEKEPLFLRREAVLAIGNLNPALFSGGTVKAPELVKAIGNFLLQLTKAGSGRDLADPENLAKVENVFPPPFEPTEEEKKKKQDSWNKKLFADGVAYYLNCIATALGGRNDRGLLKTPGLDPKTRGHIDTLLNEYINPQVISFATSPQRLVADKLPQELQAMGTKLREWMNVNALIAAAGVPAAGTAAN